MKLRNTQTMRVSIHAPVKGATSIFRGRSELFMCFNPRSREGSDEKFPDMFRGDRGFNPRSREGSDRSAQGIRSP